jgi:hypothetical protein
MATMQALETLSAGGTLSQTEPANLQATASKHADEDESGPRRDLEVL